MLLHLSLAARTGVSLAVHDEDGACLSAPAGFSSTFSV